MHDACTGDIQVEDKPVSQKFSFLFFCFEYLCADSLGVLQQLAHLVLGAVGMVHRHSVNQCSQCKLQMERCHNQTGLLNWRPMNKHS